MKKSAIFLILALYAKIALAVTFEQADLHPLLRVNASRVLTPQTGPVARAGQFDEVKVITRGGALLSVLTQQESFSSPYENRIVRGVGTSAQLATLQAKLGENRIGAQASCALDRDSEVSGVYEITWYGRGSRRNAFTVFFGAAGESRPACSGEAQAIINAIMSFEDAVVSARGTQVLVSK